jgi:hypothetical protein
MTFASRSRPVPGAARVAVVAAVAALGVLAPVRTAEGAPKTRFAVVPASVTGTARAAAAVRPEVPPAPGPTLDSPFPLSHLGVRWTGSEDAAVDIRLAGANREWGPWRALPVAHDLDDDDGGPILSELIRAQGATRAPDPSAGHGLPGRCRRGPSLRQRRGRSGRRT